MPLTEVQPDAVTGIYAQSLFELANAHGGQQAVESALGELEDVLELARADARFGEFLASRIVSEGERARALESIFKGKLADHVLKFLLVLNRKGRLSALTGVVSSYDTLVQNAFGRIEVDVYTADALAEDDRQALTGKLRTALGKEPVLHAHVDPTMIGGVKLQIGDRLIDGSASAALRKLKEQLDTNGASLVRAAADRIIDTGHVNGTH